MPEKIVEYLKLSQPELYTGHCFRRTSATILADAGAILTTLEQHGGWKSNQVAERYIRNSIQNERKISKLISNSIASSESENFYAAGSLHSSNCFNNFEKKNSPTAIKLPRTAILQITNCQNIKINITNKIKKIDIKYDLFLLFHIYVLLSHVKKFPGITTGKLPGVIPGKILKQG